MHTHTHTHAHARTHKQAYDAGYSYVHVNAVRAILNICSRSFTDIKRNRKNKYAMWQCMVHKRARTYWVRPMQASFARWLTLLEPCAAPPYMRSRLAVNMTETWRLCSSESCLHACIHAHTINKIAEHQSLEKLCLLVLYKCADSISVEVHVPIASALRYTCR